VPARRASEMFSRPCRAMGLAVNASLRSCGTRSPSTQARRSMAKPAACSVDSASTSSLDSRSGALAVIHNSRESLTSSQNQSTAFTNQGRFREAVARGRRRAGAAVSAQSTGRATNRKLGMSSWEARVGLFREGSPTGQSEEHPLLPLPNA
jgi:hypothetical protein